MKYLKYLTLITQLGLDMISAILLGCFIGYILDKIFKINSGIFFTIFMILGIISGFYNMYKNMNRIIKEKDKIKKEADKDE